MYSYGRINPLETRVLMTNSIQSFVHDLHSYTISNISSIFSSNSEAEASELLENIEETFPRFYMHLISLACSDL